MSSNNNKHQGFTLIELMVTIAILAIIIAIAVPSYRNQALRANRTEAIDALLSQAAFQQRQFTVNNQYTAAAAFNTDSGFYNITTAVANANQTYTLTAAPQNGQGDDGCGTLTLTNIGVRGATGDTQRCWAGRSN